ncbi:polysaccharide biosynthesis/export family protein [Sphingomonas changbaiensis]|nr:polysaccharide biosynthesis/export family protein [Sphingomonas changbaiensis]
MVKSATSVCVAILLSSCATGPLLESRPSLVVLPGTELPPPTNVQLAGGARPSILGPGDKLIIDVFGIEELSKKKLQVDAGGAISFPLVGSVEVAGKSPAEAAQIIESGLARYVRDPHVAVNLEETNSQVVTVEGEVKEPGRYPVLGHLTLLGAVASAKGTTEFSRLSQVIVYRTVGNQQLAALYDLKAIRTGRYEDPDIYANDIVVVGESQARRVFKDVLQAVPLVTTPIVAAITYRR